MRSICVRTQLKIWYIFSFESELFTVENEINLCLLGVFLRHAKMGQTVKRCAQEFPLLEMDAVLQPITRTIVRIRLKVIANFRYVSTFLIAEAVLQCLRLGSGWPLFC
jgi:hypothetical protein